LNAHAVGYGLSQQSNSRDAWKEQEGISKAEAKRRYVELLIGVSQGPGVHRKPPELTSRQ
jgi:hypothetical protein